MEEYTQITLDEWMQWKEDIRVKLAETAGNFVHIGYRLKQIRDSGMYDGAENVFEFAQKEYGLGKSTVSRFIAINDKYSEGGNSRELKEEFRGFSSSKLSEMLTLPDSELELITERTTIKEIRNLKEFDRQEIPEDENLPGQYGIEEYIPVPAGETPQAEPPAELTPLQKCLADYFRTRPEQLSGVLECLSADPPDYREAMERMNPSGQSSHRKGMVFLFLYDWNTGIKYRIMGQPDTVSMTWPELLDLVSGGAAVSQQTAEPEVPQEAPQKESEEIQEDDDRKSAEPAGSIGEPEAEAGTDDAESEECDAGDQPGSDECMAAEEAGSLEEPETEEQTTDDNSVATSQQAGRFVSGMLTCTIHFEGLYVAPGETETDALFGDDLPGEISNETWVFDD